MQRKLCPMCRGVAANPRVVEHIGTDFDLAMASGSLDSVCQCCGGYGYVYEASLNELADVEEWESMVRDFGSDYDTGPDELLLI